MSDADAPTVNLLCPKCRAPMESVRFHDITVDRCTACKGLWFDLMEHRHLRQIKGAADAIDIGPARAGEHVDQPVKMNCPRCTAPMTRLRDVDDRQIVYEYCTICNGAFFDAGEFRHYAQHSFIETVREWFKRS
jgi:uncharacterized protein